MGGRIGGMHQLGHQGVELVTHLVTPGDEGPCPLFVTQGQDLAHQGDARRNLVAEPDDAVQVVGLGERHALLSQVEDVLVVVTDPLEVLDHVHEDQHLGGITAGVDGEVDDQLTADLHLGDVDLAVGPPDLVGHRGHRTAGDGVHGQVEGVSGIGHHALDLGLDVIDAAVIGATEEAHDHGRDS